ncbi:unnamed protein product, partial [Brenthis ino]
MENIEELLKNVRLSQFEMERGEEVDITCIVDLRNFYIRPVKYTEFIEKFETIKPQEKPTTLNIQDMVVFNLQLSDSAEKYVRGKILFIDDTDGLKCDIFTVDYGFFEKSVPLKYIWNCEQKYLDIPQLISHCGLARYDPCDGEVEWPQEEINVFKYYLGTESVHMRIVENNIDKLMVELYNDQPEDIASMMGYRIH